MASRVLRATVGVLLPVLLVTVGCGGSTATAAGEGASEIPALPAHVIPLPVALVQGEGSFGVPGDAAFFVASELADVAARQVDGLRRTTGLALPAAPADDAALSVRFTPDTDAEGYRLSVGGEGIVIEAGDQAGVYYAFQTLRQLLQRVETEGGAVWAVPSLEITDAPRFPYRGMHLDVGRFFFDVEVVKRYIDTIARFKFNRFHWHLTEDQGWRIQIDAYPRLTEVGAWRAESPVDKNINPYVGDGTPHGGFYTKEQIREVVAYAAERFVTVVPEIEMPGHATAAIAAYPQLGCTDETLEVSRNWGIHDSILCPKEETFEFLETVLSEVMELFPSEAIHIGADEVPRRQWRNSAQAQAVMRREGLADEDELQSWFIRRIERHLRANGRRLIGWDEILEGGLAPDATVMSWRGTEGGIAAAQQGHDVIMTPAEYAYFDFYQGDEATEPLAMSWAGYPVPLATVYEFEPVPDALSDSEAAHILGAQGNLWTEYIRTPEQLEYMAFPRALALAEVVWTPAERRDWPGFVDRLGAVLPQLDGLGVNYRMPEEVTASRAASAPAPHQGFDLEDGLYAEIVTSKGTILVRLEPDRAPMTVASFVGLAEGTIRNTIRGEGEPAFDGAVFHRVVAGHVIQAGEGAGFRYPNEIHADLSHDHAGAIGIPNGGPHTNSAGFYITLGDRSYLDGNYNVFGDVVEGLDVVMAIEQDDVVEQVRIVRVGAAAEAYRPDTRSFFAHVRAAERGVESDDAARVLATERWLAERFPAMRGVAPGIRQQITSAGAAGGSASGQTARFRYSGVALRWRGHIVGLEGPPLLEIGFASGEDGGPGWGPSAAVFGGAGSVDRLPAGLDPLLAQMLPGESRRVFLPPWEAYGTGGFYGPDEPGVPRFVISPRTSLLIEIERVGSLSQSATAQEAALQFDAVESRLLEAASVCLAFHITSEGAAVSDLRGVFELGPGGAATLAADGTFVGQPVEANLQAQDDEYAYGNRDARATVATPPHLREALVIGMTRMGLLHNLAMLMGGAPPDHADGGVREWVTVRDIARDGEALTFNLTVAGEPSGSARLQLDAAGTPAERWQTVMFPEGEMRVVERYTPCVDAGDHEGASESGEGTGS